MRRSRAEDTFLYIVVVVMTLFFIAPLLWVFLSAFKTRLEIFTLPPVLVPSRFNLDNFERVLSANTPFLMNSVIVTASTTVVVMAIAIPASFALAVFDYRRKRDIEIWVLSTRMMPPIAAAVALFILGQYAGLLDTRLFLTLVYIGFLLPFAIWLLTSFFRDLPGPVLEAAIVDGASWWQVLRHIVVPISSSGIATVTIFTGLFAWNELLIPLFLTSRQAKTFTVVLTEFQGQTNTVWEQMSAAVAIQVIPVVILVFLVQRYIVSGLTLGAVKE
jgi:ABC-type glycerol-3-phosphate transport system permease component